MRIDTLLHFISVLVPTLLCDERLCRNGRGAPFRAAEQWSVVDIAANNLRKSFQ